MPCEAWFHPRRVVTVRLPELGFKIRDVVIPEYIEYRNKKDSSKPFLSRLCALSRVFLSRILRFVDDRFLINVVLLFDRFSSLLTPALIRFAR